jgi:hypothetical protein
MACLAPTAPQQPLGELSRLDQSHLLPPGAEATTIGGKDFNYLQPGLPHPVRVTTDPAFFDAHPDSSELWSPGSPLFPKPEWVNEAPTPSAGGLHQVFWWLTSGSSSSPRGLGRETEQVAVATKWPRPAAPRELQRRLVGPIDQRV